MAAILKPANLSLTWAGSGDILDPGDSKYSTGWAVEIPPRQWFNYIDNRQDEAIAHINQHGVAVWDDVTEYQANKSYVQGVTNGTIYRCKQTHTNQRPEDDVAETFWQIAFASSGDFYTKAQTDAAYLAKSANGSDIANAATFRTNLSLYSQAQLYTRTEVDARTTKASQAQAIAGTSDTVLMTPLRTEQWGAENVLGLGQSWVDVKAIRAANVTYTNSTGSAILVSLSLNAAGSGVGGIITVGGVVATSGNMQSIGSLSILPLSTIVPAGSTYSLSGLDGTDTINTWAELR